MRRCSKPKPIRTVFPRRSRRRYAALPGIKGDSPMLTRRSLIAATAAGPVAAGFAPTARAATPRDIIVMAKQIDDIVSFDPAESYEFSNNEVDANVYRRLVGPDPDDGTKVVGDAAASWTVSPDGRVFTFVLKPDVIFPSGKAATAEDAA